MKQDAYCCGAVVATEDGWVEVSVVEELAAAESVAGADGVGVIDASGPISLSISYSNGTTRTRDVVPSTQATFLDSFHAEFAALDRDLTLEEREMFLALTPRWTIDAGADWQLGRSHVAGGGGGGVALRPASENESQAARSRGREGRSVGAGPS
ncbi:hypothetical protein FGB62_2g17 [Gracilaria domingensis]|nr:hypothetical protein FGB62_2g17 [Gracilaria domingensis]